jgi:hypothetical protein
LLAACSLLVDTSDLSGGAPDGGAADAPSEVRTSPDEHDTRLDDATGVPEGPFADGPEDVVAPDAPPGSDASDGSDAQDSAVESSIVESGVPDAGPGDGGGSVWSSTDIGAVQATGRWCLGSQCTPALPAGTFQVTGSGTDLGLCPGEMPCGHGAYDEFRYVYQPIAGDATLTARVISIQNVGSDWSKAFVMMRDGVASDAAFAAVGVPSGTSHGFVWLDRTSAGGPLGVVQTASSSTPIWLQVTRRGSTFTGSTSPDGSTWTQVGSMSITMSTTLDIGLGVVSHVNGALAAGTFDSVSLTTP